MQLAYEIVGDKLKMECGCEFDIREHRKPFPRLERFDYNKLPDCKRVWEMLGQGIVKGVFQLESGLGKSWASKVKPESLEHMSALGAILRPGSLESKAEDGHSMTEHYALRKNGLEPVDSIHPIVDDILKDTYGIFVYQEQAIWLVVRLAGFSPSQADLLRKAMGEDRKSVV